MSIVIFESAELTLRDGRKLNVPIRENISCFEPYNFGHPRQAATALLVVIDNRNYQDVTGLVYVGTKGERIDALAE